MKKLCALAVLAAGLTGCTTSSTPEAKTTLVPPIAPQPAPRPAYASLNEAQQLERIQEELRAIGTAMQKYAWDHNGQFPPRLSFLVAQGYLPAGALISSADPSGGKEGGVPDAYSEWSQSKETDEPGSSYLYEFSETACLWDWASYLRGNPTQATIDTNKDGTVSWAEAKTWQLQHGDTTQSASRAYAKNRFPIVRCYWYRYPDAYADITIRSTVNLAVDLQSIFIAQPWWEKDTL